MTPRRIVSSEAWVSMRCFQKRIVSGNPSRSRGPGRSERKKAASWRSKARRPLGITRTPRLLSADRNKGAAMSSCRSKEPPGPRGSGAVVESGAADSG